MSHIPLNSKPHFIILDALRGVAALMVVIFHICEAHATSHFDQVINHGYLAVDFFFLLSGYVIAYAYDDKWNTFTIKDFFLRRLIRLQPMVVIGMAVGAVCFYFGASAYWPKIAQTPLSEMLLVMFIGFTLVPITPTLDIRGWSEMHPLNGPAWSLFFEYIANIIYALFLKRATTPVLMVLVIAAALLLLHLGLTSPAGDVVGGWSLDATQLHIGFSRMLFPFLAGLLLSRTAKITYIPNAMLLCSGLLVLILAFPRVGGKEILWVNGLYDTLSIILLFPCIVYMGAGGTLQNVVGLRVAKWLGAISYPVYITHYPLIYIYTAWVQDYKPDMSEALPMALLVFAGSIILAYACLKLYDEHLRRWLQNFLISKTSKKLQTDGLK